MPVGSLVKASTKKGRREKGNDSTTVFHKPWSEPRTVHTYTAVIYTMYLHVDTLMSTSVTFSTLCHWWWKEKQTHTTTVGCCYLTYTDTARHVLYKTLSCLTYGYVDIQWYRTLGVNYQSMSMYELISEINVFLLGTFYQI